MELHGYAIRNGELTVGDRMLSDIAAQFGDRPFYVYSRQLIDARIAQLRAALPPALGIHYAIKANPLPALVNHVAALTDGLDVASRMEMQTALASGMAAQQISFAGPGKTRADLQAAVEAGVLLNIESRREVLLLAELGRQLGQRPRVAVRINPAFELRGAGMRMGGGPRPFGVDEEQVPALLDEIGALGLRFEGFHIYAGSQNLRSDAIASAQEKSYALALRLAAQAPAPVSTLNLGGGFGIPYFRGESELDLKPISQALSSICADAASQLPGARLHLELGRYLVGPAGLYVSRIVDKKISRGISYLITAGGMNHHLAASGNLGQVIRKNYPVAIGNHMQESPTQTVTICGPLCTPLDILAEQVELPQADIGDLVVLFQSGAYGASASPQGFLSFPCAAEMLL
jgi:diaminopimelate decarboxylase